MRNALRPLVIAMVIMLSPAAARATTILYQATNLAGTTWQYDYFIGSGAFPAQQGFAVFFDDDLYSNLQLLPPNPPDWQVLLTQPDDVLDSDGTYDAKALVNDPAFVGPFSLSFTWLGNVGTAPGAQPFEVYVEDLFTGDIDAIETGETTPLAAIPEPSSALLVATGIAALRTFRRRRGQRPVGRC